MIEAELIIDGTSVSAGGYPVGMCNSCRSGQSVVFYLDNREYCRECFTGLASVKALRLAQEISDKMDTMLNNLTGGVKHDSLE